MSEPTIYHNPQCSKSCAVLTLLEQHGHHPQVVDYLAQPPSVQQLAELCRQLGISPRELVRDNEPVFTQFHALAELDDSGWLEAMVAHPILIQRPIVVCAGRAVLGRPPERVLDILI